MGKEATTRSVDELIRTGAIRVVRLGRRIVIARRELEDWLQRSQARRIDH